jgi:hypothetical protein
MELECCQRLQGLLLKYPEGLQNMQFRIALFMLKAQYPSLQHLFPTDTPPMPLQPLIEPSQSSLTGVSVQTGMPLPPSTISTTTANSSTSVVTSSNPTTSAPVVVKKRGGIKRKAVQQLYATEPERIERNAKRQRIKKEKEAAACVPLFYIITKGQHPIEFKFYLHF